MEAVGLRPRQVRYQAALRPVLSITCNYFTYQCLGLGRCAIQSITRLPFAQRKCGAIPFSAAAGGDSTFALKYVNRYSSIRLVLGLVLSCAFRELKTGGSAGLAALRPKKRHQVRSSAAPGRIPHRGPSGFCASRKLISSVAIRRALGVARRVKPASRRNHANRE